MDEFELEIKKAFLEESEALLDEAESAFIALDAGNTEKGLVDEIFRAAHSFKGGASAVGFKGLATFSHKLEDVITFIKTGELKPTRSVCSVLLEALDVLKNYLNGLKQDFNFHYDSSATEEKLKNIRAFEDRKSLVAQADTTKSSHLEAAVASVPSASEIESPVFEEIANLPFESAETPKTGHPVSKVVTAKVATAKTDDDGIRIRLKKLDELLNIVGELVVNESMLSQHRVAGTLSTNTAIQTLSYVGKLVSEIQHVSLSLRMVPAKPLFQKMRRVVRDVSHSLDKEVEFITDGEDVEIDKNITDEIADPITHMIRNAVDHGLETRAERIAAGKPVESKVWLSALPQEDRIVISIKDDGRGLNREKLIKKAIEKGIIKEGQIQTDQEAYNLIFAPGFSTKETVTDFSGRGVGMDVVRRAIEDLKGSIQINTELGKGTEFIISLPLSLSIITGMVILIDGRRYVVPVNQLVETIEYRKLNVETTQGKGKMVNLRNEILPVYSLSQILHPGLKKSEVSTNLGLVSMVGGVKVSFMIDEILGQQQIVLKKLGRELRGLPGVVAAAILADGEPGMVLSLYDFINIKMKGNKYAAA